MQRTLLLVILLAAPAALAAPAERLDALDFDNGALLVEASPSYAAGTSNWSAWGLADGGDAGWCSAKDKPKGNTFVWELDGPWRLDAFAVSTKGMQEDGYPGISAKTVELWGAPAKGDFEKLVKLADNISEQADSLAEMFGNMNDVLMSRLGGNGRSSSSSSSSSGQSGSSRSQSRQKSGSRS